MAVLAALPSQGRGLPKLDVSAPSAIIIGAETGQVLWSKDADAPRYPASTTKIMTALLLIEHCKPDDIITAPQGIENVRESSMHLKSGEQVTVHDMLYALLLRSANDGCVAVADHISGSVPAFAALMNQRARELGCTHTHFDNPNGLNDDKHTISARDLSTIAREAMTYPVFRDAVRHIKYRIKRSINEQDTWMVNRDKLLRKDPTADGIKTGWTIPAGHCFVGSATRDGFRVITVVMHSANWQDDHEKMLDWAFKNFHAVYLSSPKHPLSTPVQTDGGETISATLDHPRYFLRPNGDRSLQYHLELASKLTNGTSPAKIAKPIKKGERIGTFIFNTDDSTFEGAALASDDYHPATLASTSTRRLTTPTMLIGGVLAGGAFAMRKRARRKYGGWLGPR